MVKEAAAVARDLAVTGFGMWVAASQVRAAHPSDVLLAFAAVLIGGNGALHASRLLAAPITGQSPQSPPQSSSPSSSSAHGVTGE